MAKRKRRSERIKLARRKAARRQEKTKCNDVVCVRIVPIENGYVQMELCDGEKVPIASCLLNKAVAADLVGELMKFIGDNEKCPLLPLPGYE